MFSNIKALTALDISNFDMTKVTDVRTGCLTVRWPAVIPRKLP